MDGFTRDRMIDAINGALYVKVDMVKEMVLVWKGGHTVNVYGIHDWSAINCFTFGWNDDKVKVEDAIAGIGEYLEEVQGES